ncbi:uncharacterized protein TNCV_2864041 [Trichonephila clavipes]|nr:uncharacterized protein TNCV_2864041 [Trichonephila clavipes]
MNSWSTPQATNESRMTCRGTEPKALDMSSHATNLFFLQRRAASRCCVSRKLCSSTPSYGEKPFCAAKTFLDSPVNIIPHKSLNTSRGVISEPDLLTTPEAEILDGFSDQGVIQSHQSDSKLCSKWKLEKKIQEIKTSKNISYPEARKLILPQISQTYSQATKSSTTTTTTQTDDSITKIVCPPLKLLQPLSAVLKPTMPFKIPTVTKLSASTEAQLLPTTSSSAAKSSESQPPVPSVITTSSASISLITSTTTMFTALSNKTHPSALETTTSNSIPSTIISPVSHASTLKSRRKKRNPKTICNVTGPTVKPKIEIKMAPHKPRKSSSIQDTDDEDMIVYDMAEQIESPKKNDKYFLSEEYWKNESWRQGGFLHVITPTRVRNNQK